MGAELSSRKNKVFYLGDKPGLRVREEWGCVRAFGTHWP